MPLPQTTKVLLTIQPHFAPSAWGPLHTTKISNASLVITASTGGISELKIDFKAEEDVVIDANLTATAGDIKLSAKNGSVNLDDPTLTGNSISVKAGLDFIATNGDFLIAIKKIFAKVGRDIDVSNSDLDGGGQVKLQAGGDITGNDAKIKAPLADKGKVDLKAKGKVDISGSNTEVHGDKSVKISADGDIDAASAEIAACSTKGGQVKMTSKKGNVNADGVQAYAYKKVTIESKGTAAGTGNVSIQNATLANTDGSPKGDLSIKAKDTIFANGANFWSLDKIDRNAPTVTGPFTDHDNTQACPY